MSNHINVILSLSVSSLNFRTVIKFLRKSSLPIYSSPISTRPRSAHSFSAQGEKTRNKSDAFTYNTDTFKWIENVYERLRLGERESERASKSGWGRKKNEMGQKLKLQARAHATLMRSTTIWVGHFRGISGARKKHTYKIVAKSHQKEKNTPAPFELNDSFYIHHNNIFMFFAYIFVYVPFD